MVILSSVIAPKQCNFLFQIKTILIINNIECLPFHIDLGTSNLNTLYYGQGQGHGATFLYLPQYKL